MRVATPGAVTSPPYDVIGAAEHRRLLARSPYNVVRLLLTETEDATYQGAAGRLRAWRAEGILVPDPEPRLYLYEIDYPGPGGTVLTARGVLGALDVVELGDRVVPHEETMDKHRADRMAVLAATEANIDPIIALSPAPDLAPLLAPSGPPRLDFEVDGTRHRLSDVTDGDAIAAISAAVAAHPVSIADGHHRYTTALAYRRSREERDGTGPWGAILAMVAPAEGSGLTVGPYHRVFPSMDVDLHRLEDGFTVTATDPAAPVTAGDLVLVRHGHASVLIRPDASTVAALPLPWHHASTAVAREVLYPRLGIDESSAFYVPGADEALTWVGSHPGSGALLVAPVTEHAIAVAGEAGLRFPQKTTYFTPKPRAGLVMRAFADAR